MNLVSVAKITDRGFTVIFDKVGAHMIGLEGYKLMMADREKDLYYVKEAENVTATVECKSSDIWLWYERFGHLNGHDLDKIVRNKLNIKMSTQHLEELKNCSICARGKMSSQPFQKGDTPCKDKLMIVHSDVVGLINIESNDGARYFITFIDDSTRWCDIFC